MSSKPHPDPASKSIRVLHVLEATLGGTLRYMENIAEATRGLELVSGFAYGTARADSRLNAFLTRISSDGWQSYPIDMYREVQLTRDFKAWLQLRKVIRHFAPDIIHCHSSKAGALGRAAALVRTKATVLVYSPHALAAAQGQIYLKIEKWLSRCTDRFIAVSESERDEILGYSLATGSTVSVVYPSVDSQFFQPSSREAARQALGMGSAPLLVAIGRVAPQKNPLAFLQITKQIYEKRPDVRAIWVGAGSGEAEFRSQIRDANMEHIIRVVPWQHDVRIYIAAADILLSTSNFESFGYIAAEALAMKRPVVASNVTGTRDILGDRFSDWLYKPERTDLATDLILKLLKCPEEALAVGELGRSEVERRFSTTRMRDSLTQAYQAALYAPRQNLSKKTVIA